MQSECSVGKDPGYFLDHIDIENEDVERVVEHDDDVNQQVEDNQNEKNGEISKMNIEESDEHSEKDLDIARGFVTETDESTDTTDHLVVEDIRLAEKTELTDENVAPILQEISEERSDCPVNPVTDGFLRDSLDHMQSSEATAIVVGDLEEPIRSQEMILKNIDLSPSDVENRDFAAMNSESNEVNMENNMTKGKNILGNDTESGGGQQNYDSSLSNIVEIDNTVITESVKDPDCQSLEQDMMTENTSVKKTSPKLGKRASSLLSALKDEITGVSSQNVQTEESLTPPLSTTGTSVIDIRDTQHTVSAPTKVGFTSEVREITNVTDNKTEPV